MNNFIFMSLNFSNFFNPLTQVKLKFSKQIIWTRKDVSQLIKHHFDILTVKYKDDDSLEDILSNFELSFINQFYPNGSNKNTPITMEMWKESKFYNSAHNNQKSLGFYRVKSGIGSGIISGLHDKFNNKAAYVWIINIIAFINFFIINPLIWISIYILLSFILPQKSELTNYLEDGNQDESDDLSKTNSNISILSIIDSHINPIFIKLFGFFTLIGGILSFLYHSYLFIGFILIEFTNWPKI
jgi:phage shock protein PspC (stress-responsive transcriptional regulator)